MTIGKIGVAHRVWFGAQSANGSARSGLVTADFAITVRDPGNTATMASPTVTEVAGTGLYFFDILAAFTTTRGAGEYGVFIEVTTPPRAVDDPRVVVFANTFDDLAGAGFVSATHSLFAAAGDRAARETDIHGADDDDLKTLSDQIDALSASSDAAPVIKVSAIATSASPATVRLMAVLERGGQLVTGPTSATISLKEPDGTVLIASAAMLGPNSDGVFRRDVAAVLLVDARNYYADVTITDGVGAVREAEITPTIA